jgi:hypothetical protein
MSRLYLAVVLFIVPATLRAQETFTPLDSGLRVGETIHALVDAPCATKACPGELVKGKIAKLSDASLVVDDGRKRRELAAAWAGSEETEGLGALEPRAHRLEGPEKPSGGRG